VADVDVADVDVADVDVADVDVADGGVNCDSRTVRVRRITIAKSVRRPLRVG
jgi:hypothetical protein